MRKTRRKFTAEGTESTEKDMAESRLLLVPDLSDFLSASSALSAVNFLVVIFVCSRR